MTSRRRPGPPSERFALVAITPGSGLAKTGRSVLTPPVTDKFRGMGPGFRQDDTEGVAGAMPHWDKYAHARSVSGLIRGTINMSGRRTQVLCAQVACCMRMSSFRPAGQEVGGGLEQRAHAQQFRIAPEAADELKPDRQAIAAEA
ncbi:hypothetical protein SAMN04487925_10782 [Bradyrhizobium sp. cf659]|nr:hypothetical protein SAMN04487925_10782 [Bradyrhizobium sp. cf659]